MACAAGLLLEAVAGGEVCPPEMPPGHRLVARNTDVVAPRQPPSISIFEISNLSDLRHRRRNLVRATFEYFVI